MDTKIMATFLAADAEAKRLGTAATLVIAEYRCGGESTVWFQTLNWGKQWARDWDTEAFKQLTEAIDKARANPIVIVVGEGEHDEHLQEIAKKVLDGAAIAVQLEDSSGT